jgi:hypothetical protein
MVNFYFIPQRKKSYIWISNLGFENASKF